jgi:hypothetical protein
MDPRGLAGETGRDLASQAGVGKAEAESGKPGYILPFPQHKPVLDTEHRPHLCGVTGDSLSHRASGCGVKPLRP